MKDSKYIHSWLKKHLKTSRYKHLLGTEKIAKRLAEKHGLDPDKAALAGLIHDCAKYLDADKLLKYAKENNIVVDEITEKMPLLLHAPVGAVIAVKKFNIHDKEILSAVANHAVPSLNMSRMDMLINLCDLIEENRKFNDIDVCRSAAEKSIEEGFTEALRITTYHMLKKGSLVHPNSIIVYNRLKMQNL